MTTLTPEQLKRVAAVLTSRCIPHPTYKIEFFDHIACMTEQNMAAGDSFEAALDTVMLTYNDETLQALLIRTTRPAQQKAQFKTFANKAGLVTGILICLWFAFEYLVSQWSGILELGAIYGVLSEAILISAIIISTRQLIKLMIPGDLNFKQCFLFNMRVILIAAGIVLIFAPVYTYYINPELIGIYDQSQGPVTKAVSLSTTIAMVLGTIYEGLVLTTIVSLTGRVVKWG